MKRTVSIGLVILILLNVFVCFASAQNKTTETIEHFEDGSYGVICIKTVFSLFASKSSITRTKEYKYYDSSNNLDWKASITATFTYNGTTASCTNVSKSTTVYDTSWKCTASSCNKSGATATGDFTFKQYVSFIPVKTINKTLTLTCDKNGNVS